MSDISILQAINRFDDLSFDDIATVIDQEFIIHVYGVNYIGSYINFKMMSFRTMAEFIHDQQTNGRESALKMARKALNCKSDIYRRKLKRGLTIRFKVR